ncbi:MAG: TolC family protein [Bacteroidaceae bacterium]|nr:TolC family protein [Bacteroidaceae bacterium]
MNSFKTGRLLLMGFAFVAGGANAQNAVSPAGEELELTLDKAIEIALSENPTIKVAGQDIELKKISLQEAKQSYLPEFNLTAQYTRTIEKQTMSFAGQSVKVGIDNSYNAGVSMNLPVYAPALYATTKLSKSDLELSVEKARASKLDLVNQVTKAYYQLLLAQDSYEVLCKSYKQSEDNYNVVKAKFEQGSVSEYDKISAEVQMRSIKPSVVSAKNAINLAQLQLKVLMGITTNYGIHLSDNLKNYESGMENFVPRNYSLDNNSSLRQLNLNAGLLDKGLKVAKTAFLPTVSLTAAYLYTSLANDFKFSNYKWNPYAYATLNISIPLYKASNFTKVKSAKLQREELNYTILNTERQLNMQVISYQNNMSASSEQLASNREAVAQAEKARLIADKRYQVGRGTILELNSSEVALTQAQLTYDQSIYDFIVAKSDLDYVLGTNDELINKGNK